MKKIVVATSLILAAAVCSAQSQLGPYAGLGVGGGAADHLDAPLAGVDAATNGIQGTSLTGRAFVGWQITPLLGAEFGYANLGSYTRNSATSSYSPQGFASDVSMTARWPLTEGVVAVGRLGAANTHLSSTSIQTSDNVTGTLGMGLEFQVTPTSSLFLEAVQYGALAHTDITVSMVNMGLKVNF